jgi:hypothetical protein
MTSNLLVERKNILLGDIDLEVFRLPDGSYQLSQTQTAKAVEKPELSTRQFLASQSPYALPYKDFTPVKGKVKGEKTSVNLIPIPIAAAYWVKEAIAGNTVAGFLLAATAAESIERRADQAYGVKKSEEEYNQKIAEIRNAGTVTRNRLTNTIQTYIVKNGVKGNKAKYMICNTTKKINTLLFGKSAKKIQEEGGKAVTRDNLSFFELRDLENLENTACTLIETKNFPPDRAIETAYGLLTSMGSLKKVA